MDENRDDLLENSEQEIAENETSGIAQEEQPEISADAEVADEISSDVEIAAEISADAKDDNVILEDAAEEITDDSKEEPAQAQTQADKTDDQSEASSSEEFEGEEAEIELAKYAVDCESCATRVYFELEDLDEEDNLLCPNCSDKIEINREAINYYLVDKSALPKELEDYVADCPACEAVVHFTPEEIDDEENIVCPQCGESIHIETEVLDAYKQKDLEKALKRKRFLKKIFAIVSGVLLAVLLAAAVIWFAGSKSVITVDGTSVPLSVYRCVYYCENATNYRNAGFDFTKKPSAQPFDGEEYETWDDLLRKATDGTLKIYYSIYNEGKKAGYELTDKDREQIEDTVKSLYSYADAANMSFSDYMHTNYGIKINEKQFREYLEVSAYVNSYYQSVMSKDVTDEQLENIYKDNPDNFETVTFRYYYLAIDENTTKELALNRLESIAAATTEDKFVELVKKDIAKSNSGVSETAEQDTLIKDMAVKGLYDRPVSELLLNEKAAVLQTACGVSDDESFAEVAMIIEPRHKNDDLIMQAALTEVGSQKGSDYISSVSDDTVVKASIGFVIRVLTF